jgi:hypothetical protein
LTIEVREAAVIFWGWIDLPECWNSSCRSHVNGAAGAGNSPIQALWNSLSRIGIQLFNP